MELKWKHPFTAIISGPTSSGKSTFIKKFLTQLDHMVDTTLSEVVYCAPAISQSDLSETGRNVKYHEGIPDMEMFSDQQPRVIILDDMMREADERVVDWFSKGSHHCNHSVVSKRTNNLLIRFNLCFDFYQIFITQNIFNQGKGRRDISLNAHYIVAMKSPRDRSQIIHLARQIYPENTAFIREIFSDATSTSYGYLLFDLTQTTPDHLRYRTNIFPNDEPKYIVYVPKNFSV